MIGQQETSKPKSSRRKFLQGALTAVYVAPLVVSMPARATKAGYGSGKTDKDQKHDDKRKDKHKAKYEPKNCPDPKDKDGRGNTFQKYTQSPYSPNKQLSQGPANYKFQGSFKFQSKK